MGFNFIDHYRNLAIENYKVDPIVFVVLILITIPFYYYSLFVMGRVVYRLKEKHRLKGKEVLRHKDFVRAFIVNEVAFVFPYIYIFFWGRNIPFFVWLALAAYIALSGYLLYSRFVRRAHD